MNVLLWFKRDLRVADHPAMVRASTLGPVLPLYIVEPEYWELPDTSARQWSFTQDCLYDLRAALQAIGLPLVVRIGDAQKVISQLHRAYRIERILSHEETGNDWTYQRDRKVAAWARTVGLRWDEMPQSGVVRRLPHRNGWAARRDAFMNQPAAVTPVVVPVPGVEPGHIPTLRALRIADDRCIHRQSGGRTQGLLLLDSFLLRRGESYREAMSSPVSGEQACSRLSPHLALGTISTREVVKAAQARAAQRPGGHWRGAMGSFQSRLAWRDHFVQKLEDEPALETRCLHRLHEGLRPREPDATRLAAWGKGETGLPFVDACMRYLRATGWLNFRMRSMLMAVASYHLWLDWRSTGPHLARMFTDYEPGIHWPQVQMQSGTTGINTIRIYNPVKQGYDQDPKGTFIRAWVPELAEVPDTFLQEPWKWPGAGAVLGRLYPEPVVDVAAAARSARNAVWAMRREPVFQPEARRVLDRHQGPTNAAGLFVNDRMQRKRTAPRPASAQLCLDL